MKTKELIKELLEFPMDSEVHFNMDYDSFVVTRIHDGSWDGTRPFPILFTGEV